MPGVYVALANSHFGACAKRETEHLKNKHRNCREGKKKNHSEVKFNEKQKLKAFLNQFCISQHNVITESFPVTGLCVCSKEGRWVGDTGEQDKPLRSFSNSTEYTESPVFQLTQLIPEFCFLFLIEKMVMDHEEE